MISADNLGPKKELNEFYAQMDDLDEEAKATKSQESTEIDTEQINIISIKSKVNLENEFMLAGSPKVQRRVFPQLMRKNECISACCHYQKVFLPLNMCYGKQNS